jgi:hypothetical protein
MVAAEGDSYYLPYAAAYQDNVLPGSNKLAFTIPKPANNLNVNSAGLAKWTGSAKVYLLHIVDVDYYDDYLVLTSAKQAGFPAESETGIAIPSGHKYTYTVETHGAYDSVDAAAGANGFLEGLWFGVPEGPRRGSGTYTSSAAVGYTSP